MPEIEAKVEFIYEAPRKTVVEVILASPQEGPPTIHFQREADSWTSTSPSFVITQSSEPK